MDGVGLAGSVKALLIEAFGVLNGLRSNQEEGRKLSDPCTSKAKTKTQTRLDVI
jgi:hypothetical protein